MSTILETESCTPGVEDYGDTENVSDAEEDEGISFTVNREDNTVVKYKRKHMDENPGDLVEPQTVENEGHNNMVDNNMCDMLLLQNRWKFEFEIKI